MSSPSKKLQVIIELTGKTGAGKTTLATLLSEELAPAPLLMIDASPDQKLTISMAPNPPELTLGQLFNLRTEATGSREAIDWAFHDLTTPVGEEHDLMTVGNLAEEIGAPEREKLRYGLNRLIQTYSYVIVDGYHALLRQLLPEDSIRTLEVVTPEGFSDWKPSTIEAALHTPSLILNRYSGEPLPKAMDEILSHQQARLIGKLPSYATAEDCIRKLPDDFLNCLLKMDIPLNLRSQ